MTHSWIACWSRLPPMGRRGVPKTTEEVMTMHDRLLRRRQVEEITGMSRSSIYRLMQDGQFPRPVKVGTAAVRWRASDITAWVESRPDSEPAPSDPDGPNRRLESTGPASLQTSRSGSPPNAASARGAARTGRTWRTPARSSSPTYGQEPPPRRPREYPSAPASSS